MSTIDKLVISGIRSFDPNSRQEIEFFKPLTIILGANGAGKTTIIESLLNACTGALPPGSSGTERSSFIYDPKATLEAGHNVRGQVRLGFTYSSGAGSTRVNVVRSYLSESNRDRTKATFKTLDCNVEFVEEGVVKSHSLKASDCDVKVPELLGVSKAVLQHVIFCHQESSNWPLGPPSQVKESFDELFAATRYVAALDKIKDVIKEQNSDLKTQEAELLRLNDLKAEAERLQAQLDRKSEMARDIRERAKEAEPQVQRMAGVVQALERLELGDDDERQLDILQGQLIVLERGRRELEAEMNGPPNQQHENLKVAKSRFDSDTEALRMLLLHQRNDISVVKKELTEVEKEKTDLEARLKMLSSEESTHKENVRQLQQTLKHIASTMDGPGLDALVADEKAIDRAALQRLEDSVRRSLVEAKETEQKAQKECESGRVDLTSRQMGVERARHEARLQMEHCQRQLQELDENIKERRKKLAEQEGLGRDIVARLTRVATATAAIHSPTSSLPLYIAPNETQPGNSELIIQQLQQRLDLTAAAVRAEEEKHRSGEHYKNEQQLIREEEAATQRWDALRAALEGRKAQERDATELSVLKKKRDTDNNALNEYLTQILIPKIREAQQQQRAVSPGSGGSRVELLHADAPLPAVHTAIAQLLVQRNRQTDMMREKVAVADREHAAAQEQRGCCDCRLSEVQEAIDTLRKRYDDKVMAILGRAISPEDFTKVLQETEAALREQARTAINLESMERCSADYIAIARTRKECSVCDRALTDADLVSFIKNNEARQRDAPAKIAAARQEVSRLEARLQELNQLSSIVWELLMKEGQIPQLRTEAVKWRNEVDMRAMTLSRLRTMAATAEEGLQQAQALEQEAVRAKGRYDEIESHRQRIQVLEQQLRSSTSQSEADEYGSFEELKATYEQARARCTEVRGRLAELRGLNKGEGIIQILEPLQKEQDLLRQSLAEFRPIATYADELAKEIVRLGASGQAIRNALSNHTARYEQAKKDLEAVRTHMQQHHEKFNLRIRNCNERIRLQESLLRDVMISASRVRDYLEKGRPEDILRVKESLMMVEIKRKQELERVEQLEKEIATKDGLLSKQGEALKNIESALRWHEIMAEMKQLRGEITSLESKAVTKKAETIESVRALLAEEYDPTLSIRDLRTRVNQRYAQLVSAKEQEKGRLDLLETDISRTRDDLSQPRFQDIEKRNLTTYIKVSTIGLAVKDLELYSKALERAVNSYHQEKITHINALIADLWRQTYRGSDIDTIEVRSEVESATNARKSYRYRVVMKRGSTELDMRNRCSAGQKVLASIVIRLALSIAFGCECGILALDEPTTNLDEDNVQSLAHALRELIRRAERHFQLIIITHDATFVRALGKESAETYYYVTKDMDGAFSQIRRKRYNELFLN